VGVHARLALGDADGGRCGGAEVALDDGLERAGRGGGGSCGAALLGLPGLGRLDGGGQASEVLGLDGGGEALELGGVLGGGERLEVAGLLGGDRLGGDAVTEVGERRAGV